MIQKEVKNVNDWFSRNKLCANESKSIFMILSNKLNRQDVCPAFNDIYSKSCKYLGVHIDSNLTFRDHVSYVLRKVSKLTGLIKMMKQFVSISTLFCFYNNFIKPVIQYGILIYGSTSLGVSYPLFLKKKKNLCINFHKPNNFPSK